MLFVCDCQQMPSGWMNNDGFLRGICVVVISVLEAVLAAYI